MLLLSELRSKSLTWNLWYLISINESALAHIGLTLISRKAIFASVALEGQCAWRMLPRMNSGAHESHFSNLKNLISLKNSITALLMFCCSRASHAYFSALVRARVRVPALCDCLLTARLRENVATRLSLCPPVAVVRVSSADPSLSLLLPLFYLNGLFLFAWEEGNDLSLTVKINKGVLLFIKW